MAVSAILALLWVWLGVAYHLMFFTRINPLAYGFAILSIIGGLLFAWHSVIQRRVEFAFSKSIRTRLGIVLLVFALVVYPVWSTLGGQWLSRTSHLRSAVPDHDLHDRSACGRVGEQFARTPRYSSALVFGRESGRFPSGCQT